MIDGDRILLPKRELHGNPRCCTARIAIYAVYVLDGMIADRQGIGMRRLGCGEGIRGLDVRGVEEVEKDFPWQTWMG
jgi:hypothetical protein